MFWVSILYLLVIVITMLANFQLTINKCCEENEFYVFILFTALVKLLADTCLFLFFGQMLDGWGYGMIANIMMMIFYTKMVFEPYIEFNLFAQLKTKIKSWRI